MKYEQRARVGVKARWQHARPPPIMIPLISEVIVVLEADYIHSRDNEQGVLCVCEVKFPPTELDHLVPRRLGQFSRKFLLKMFHTGNCDSGSSDGHIIFPEIPTVPSIANMNAWTKGTFYTSNRFLDNLS